jgi:hypothetical protein
LASSSSARKSFALLAGVAISSTGEYITLATGATSFSGSKGSLPRCGLSTSGLMAEKPKVCAVGRGLGHRVHADGTAGTGPVVDDHRGAHLRGQPVAQRARDHVADAAGGVRDDEAHGLGNGGLLGVRAGGGAQRGNGQQSGRRAARMLRGSEKVHGLSSVNAVCAHAQVKGGLSPAAACAP